MVRSEEALDPCLLCKDRTWPGFLSSWSQSASVLKMQVVCVLPGGHPEELPWRLPAFFCVSSNLRLLHKLKISPKEKELLIWNMKWKWGTAVLLAYLGYKGWCSCVHISGHPHMCPQSLLVGGRAHTALSILWDIHSATALTFLPVPKYKKKDRLSPNRPMSEPLWKWSDALQNFCELLS